MNKILTVSIAAYNVEAYIKENLESILASEAREDIEVLVVDDGGKDHTLEIAQTYEKKYPGIVYAVHKENGGYGSVQNYSIQHAAGEYFKILDGDDWVNAEGLTRLVNYLKAHDTDIIITNYCKGKDKDNLREHRFASQVKEETPFDPNLLTASIGMWALTIKTEILRKSGLSLPEHTLYTDRIYATVPFSLAKNTAVLNFPVYCYRTGRDGQSVSRESRIKHIDEYLLVTKIVCRHYAEDKREHKEYILLRAAYTYKVCIRALLLLPRSKDNLLKLKQYEEEIKNTSEDVYQKSAATKTKMGRVITVLRKTNYLAYWILSFLPKSIIDY